MALIAVVAERSCNRLLICALSSNEGSNPSGRTNKKFFNASVAELVESCGLLSRGSWVRVPPEAHRGT